MTNKYLGLIQFCDEGKRLFDAYCAMLEDDTVETFGDEFVRIFEEWLNHKADCNECRYL